jgi:OmpA-OmpF porin, OOP family
VQRVLHCNTAVDNIVHEIAKRQGSLSNMSNRTIILIGLVLLTILAWFCTSGHFAQWNALRSPAAAVAPAIAPAPQLDLSATWDNTSKSVVLRGVVPSDQAKQTIAAAARTQYGADRVKDEMTVGSLAALSAGLQSSVAAFPPDLKGYITGTATLNGSGLRVVGTLPDEAAKAAAGQAATRWVAQRHPLELDLKATAVAQPVTAEVRAAAQSQITQINKALELDIVEFRTGSAELTDKGVATLQRILPALKTVSAAGFEVAGHTDSQGKAESNQALSEARANTVKDYLAKQGIAATQMSAKGFGATKPKADNATKEGRARNRRIEFNIR